jgi:EmrB/QacA subfamily drug resistance transporter
MTRLAGPRLAVAFTALMFVNAMSSVDATIVATAAPTITAELGRLSLLPWISTAYLLAQIASIPLYGKLGDVYGRQRLLVVAASLFLVASMCCGLSQTMPQLVAFRALQGAGAGGLAGLSMALVADIAPPAKLGRYLGYAGLVYALTFVLGPLTGGLFVDHLSWRWAFFINLPAGLIGGGLVVALVRNVPSTVRRRIDYFGAALLATTTTTLVLLTSWGGVEYDWASPAILALAAIVIASAAGFLAWERRAPEPLLPLARLRDRVVALATLTNLIAGMGFTALIVFLPVLFQAVAETAATESGLLLIPLGLATALTTVAAGRVVERFGGAKAVPTVGMLLMMVAYALLGTIDGDTPATFASTAGLLAGVGVGCVMQTLLHVVQRSVPFAHLGVTTSTVMLGRLSGSALGVALFGALFNNRLADRLSDRAGVDLTQVRGDPDSVRRLDDATRRFVSEAFADALSGAFRVFVVVMGVGLLTVLAQRGAVLRQRLRSSGIEITDRAASPEAVPQ